MILCKTASSNPSKYVAEFSAIANHSVISANPRLHFIDTDILLVLFPAEIFVALNDALMTGILETNRSGLAGGQ